MILQPPTVAHPPTLRELHGRRCFLLGITDPEKVERLWSEELERQKRLREDGGGAEL